MNLHNEIMNLQAPLSHAGTTLELLAYKYGHRDARHAAAELAIAADARIEELESLLEAANMGQKLAREDLAKLNAKIAEKEIDYEGIAYSHGYTVEGGWSGKYYYMTPYMFMSFDFDTEQEAWKAACEENGLLGENL